MLSTIAVATLDRNQSRKKNPTSFISTDRGMRLLDVLNQIDEMTGRKRRWGRNICINLDIARLH
jgi:hypothetical protein